MKSSTPQELPSRPDSSTVCDFFVVVVPGLEELALKEIKTWRSDLEVTSERGGLTFRSDLASAVAFNRQLKIPTRILVRIADFGCRDFPKLFRKLSKFPWDAWLPSDAQAEFSVSSHRSRLFVKRRILETCQDAFKAARKELGLKGDPQGAKFEIQVRVVDDVCTISLDTSGEILHKRGVRVLSSEAPLRESAAAALLFLLETRADVMPGSVELIDPMMGGGTFFLEAAGLKRPIQTREFAFEKFAIPHLKEASEKVSQALSGECVYGQFTGFEIDAKTVAAAKKNLSQVSSQATSFHETDFFKAEKLAPKVLSERWLIANPPYGERLKVQGSLTEYYQKFFQACESVAAPERICMLLPAKVKPQTIATPKVWKKRLEVRFANGGLPVVALLWSRG